jgi:hypothetical protein
MTLARTLRIATLVLSVAVAATGVLIMAGVLDREGIATHMRIAIGAAVVSYGAYKFTVTWFRRRGEETR